MRRARLIPSWVAILLSPAAVGAQRGSQISADFGTSHIVQPGIPSGSAQFLGGTVDAAGDAGWFRGSALGTRTAGDRWTGQALALGSIVGPAPQHARWDLTGLASEFGETSSRPIASGEAIARLRFGSVLRGGAFGGGAGATKREGAWDGLAHVQGSAWYAVDADRFQLELSTLRTRSGFGPSGTLTRASAPLTYTDAVASWRRERSGISLGVAGGVRARASIAGRLESWATADGTAWLAPNMAVVLSAGRALPDVLRGIPQTTFVTLGLHVSVEPHATVVARAAVVAGASLTMERLGSDVQRIELRGVSAGTVELMADFTAWEAVPLERVDGVWRLDRVIPAGLHRVAVRVDGGDWIAPVNLPRATDELGGVVGLLTVP